MPTTCFLRHILIYDNNGSKCSEESLFLKTCIVNKMNSVFKRSYLYTIITNCKHFKEPLLQPQTKSIYCQVINMQLCHYM